MMPETGSGLNQTHPCFYSEAKGHFGRIHLPIAPSCNIQCVYCRRDNDCLHESRPGVTSSVLSPEQALELLEKTLRVMPHISVAGIAGPGDAFCQAERTLKTFELIRRKQIDIALCVSSNGLNLLDYVPNLLELKVQFVTVTINAVDPGIGSMLYEKVMVKNNLMTGPEASGYLIDKQIQAVSCLKASGITVKVNTVVVPDVNDHHIPFIARRMQRLGVDLMNLIPLIPVPGTIMEHADPPGPAMMGQLRKRAGRFLPQMHHCKRCRSDAAGLLDGQRDARFHTHRKNL